MNKIEPTKIIIAMTFFLLFWTVMLYNFISALSATGLKEVCPDFVTKFTNANSLKVFSPNEKVGGAFYSGGGAGGGGGESGAGGIVEAIDGIWNWLTSVWDLLQGALGFLGSFVGMIGNFVLIMTTNCPDIGWIKIIFMIVFLPMFMGMMYIIIRLIKSMIPTVGGD